METQPSHNISDTLEGPVSAVPEDLQGPLNTQFG